jgi:hypothetical protein
MTDFTIMHVESPNTGLEDIVRTIDRVEIIDNEGDPSLILHFKAGEHIDMVLVRSEKLELCDFCCEKFDIGTLARDDVDASLLICDECKDTE